MLLQLASSTILLSTSKDSSLGITPTTLHVLLSHPMEFTLRPARWVQETLSRDSLVKELGKKVR
jgi:hypothetical protein